MNSDKDSQSKQERDLEKEVDSLRRDNESLQRRLDKILAENERLRKELEEALRSFKRQAAPFSKGGPKPGSEATRSQVWKRLRRAGLPAFSPASGPTD
jgi:hypothetical protein